MEGFPDAAILSQLSQAFELILNPLEDTKHIVLALIADFRERHSPLVCLTYLVEYLANPENPEPKRSVAAIFLYSSLHKRPRDAFRQFVPSYLKIDRALRDKLQNAAITSLSTSASFVHLIQCANLLGLLFALELGSRDPPASFLALIGQAETASEDVRYAIYQMVQYFAIHSLEIRENCPHDQRFVSLAPRLFSLLLSGMGASSMPNAQHKAIDAMGQSLLIFRRTFSFPGPSAKLISATAQIAGKFVPAAYFIFRRCIDYFYPFMEPHMGTIRALTFADLESRDEIRQIEACLLWSTIGDVESDFSRRNPKRKHRDFDHCFCYAEREFPQIFRRLIGLIMDTDASATDAHIALEYTPAHAAFACLCGLARATNERSIAPVLEFVTENGDAEDWRRRYTAALLLNSVCRLSGFAAHAEFAFDFFVRAIRDTIARISEVAMWSAGQMVEDAPNLLVESDRFAAVVAAVTEKLDESEELMSRGCWLLNVCFAAFDPDDDTSPIAIEFDALADLLLEALDCFGSDAQHSVMGALSRLVERTPPRLQATRLFVSLTDKLGQLIECGGAKNFPLIGDILGLIQAIVISVADIAPQANGLMQMLISALDLGSELTAEVLPAMGAVARAIRNEFASYLPQLLDPVFDFLATEEFVRPAAVFVSDVVSSIEELDRGLVGRFATILLAAFTTFEDLSFEARIAIFSALADLAKCLGPDGATWLDQLLALLEQESRASLNAQDESIDENRAASFAAVCLQVYQTLVPILSKCKNGDRKVRNFFHLFESIAKIDFLGEAVLPDCVMLTKAIAQTFQRKMSVFLNKPVVMEMLRRAQQSENEHLAELAKTTFTFVKSF